MTARSTLRCRSDRSMSGREGSVSGCRPGAWLPIIGAFLPVSTLTWRVLMRAARMVTRGSNQCQRRPSAARRPTIGAMRWLGWLVNVALRWVIGAVLLDALRHPDDHRYAGKAIGRRGVKIGSGS